MNSQERSPERAAYSVAEAAALIGIGRDGIYAAIRTGQLDCKKFGKRTVVPATAIQRFLSELPPLRLPAA